jgi:hypothetical protein
MLTQLLGSLQHKGTHSGNIPSVSLLSHLNNSCNSWVIDSGATNYITGNSNLLHSKIKAHQSKPVVIY